MTVTGKGKEDQQASTVSKIPFWKSYREIVQHSLKGSAIALLLSWGIKGSITFFLACIRLLPIVAKKNSNSSDKISKVFLAFRQAFGGIDNLRFASSITVFTFMWKFVNNSLMFLYKKDVPIKRFGAISGFVAGLAAICFETEGLIDEAGELLILNPK